MKYRCVICDSELKRIDKSTFYYCPDCHIIYYFPLTKQRTKKIKGKIKIEDLKALASVIKEVERRKCF